MEVVELSFGEDLKDILRATLRYPGDPGRAVRRYRELKAQRAFNNQIALDAMKLQGELARIVAERAKYTGTYGVKTVRGTFEGRTAQIEYCQQGDSRRVDIYYGDLRQLNKDRTKYGHIILIDGVEQPYSRRI